ncbi:MAG: hypothetical protein IKT30_00410 [Bacteroidaceae bacterium]|nr:hypothetical protein [Bacteroidaceae bacterium]
MPTKRIQLRGISRTPSDRMSADGGLAESIGFEMSENELATSVPAVNVTDDTLVGEYTDGDYEVLYIHKTNSYNHYIGTKHTVTIVEEQEVHHKYVGWFAPTPTFSNFLEYEPDETVKEIKSVGNTLIILIADLDGNSKRMEYVLFKNGGYQTLGSQIPEPRIKIESELTPAYGETGADEWEHGQFSAIYSELEKIHTNPDIWDTPWTTEHDDNWHSDEDYASFAQRVYEFSLGLVNQDLTHNLERGCFNAPVFVRYAIRLYDGSYVRHSAPVLVRGVDDLNNLEFNYYGDITTLSSGKRYTYVRRRRNSDPDDPGQAFDWLVRPYFINLFLDSTTATEFADWKDIVSGVDVFISPEINMISPKVGSITDYWNDSSHRGVIYHGHVLTDEEIRDEILSKSNFYRFLRIDYNELISRVPSEEYCTVGLEDFRQDILITKERLTDDTKQTNNYLIPNNIKVYNERLLAIGAMIKHYNGYFNIPSLATSINNVPSYPIHLRYYIRSTSGKEIIVDRTYSVDYVPSIGNWLFYPNNRCYKCVFSIGNNYSEEFEMKEHPYLNGAYCLTNFDNGTLIGHGNEVQSPTDTLDDIEYRGNVLFQFEFQNLFTPALEQSFPFGELVDIAVVTKALSTGQFGYSSLYIFTTEGLWAISVNNDGSLGKPDAVSQDVALPGTACQLEQAVVFTTKKGVMLLTGSDLRCISDKMHGRHYKLDDSLYNLLMRYYSDWSDLAIIAHEDMPFMEFMKNARTAYDYVGRRLLFFNASTERPLCKYIYTYMLETDSWHKVVMPERYRFKRVLNSYPETFIAMDKSRGDFNDDFNDDYLIHEAAHAPAIMSFSNARGQDTATRRMGMIVTRPMDLDEVDVRKVLNRLFVRGLYDKTQVKMILLGSMDGQTWQRLRSMRGGSYKQFRVMLLCELSETERISYVEAEYETRYGSRLR